jgi:hypothetical protein
MPKYLLQFDLASLTARLSASLGCRLSVSDVREILRAAGLVDSQHGWLASDLRPLAMLYLRPGGSIG